MSRGEFSVTGTPLFDAADRNADGFVDRTEVARLRAALSGAWALTGRCGAADWGAWNSSDAAAPEHSRARGGEVSIPGTPSDLLITIAPPPTIG